MIRLVPPALVIGSFALVWFLNPSRPVLALMTVGILGIAFWFIKKYRSD